MFVLYLTLFPISCFAAMCSGSLDDNERIDFVNAHNTFRSQIAKGTFTAAGNPMPSAANMQTMTWDCDLEVSAQAYANTCPEDHSGTPGVGENMYWSWSTAPISISGTGNDSSSYWANEFQEYGWSNIQYNGEDEIGHATQMAWANSNLLGCGVKQCPTTIPEFPYQINVVCQYKEPGNWEGQPVYIEGPTCSQCPSESSCSTSSGMCQ